MRDEIMAKIEKWQEPPPAKTIKPLPAPDAEQKKRRGGKRLRKLKERYGLTDVRKAANRINFNQPEEEFMDGDEVRVCFCVCKGEGFGIGDRVCVQGRRSSWTGMRCMSAFVCVGEGERMGFEIGCWLAVAIQERG